MSAVTIGDAWPGFGDPFTVAELDRMPSNGRRYELVDGVLVVSPRPTTVHQFVGMRLATSLVAACPEGLCVDPEPARPELTVFELREGSGYALVAISTQPLTLALPFPVTIAPADLTRGLLR